MAEQIPFGIAENLLMKLGSAVFDEIGLMYGVGGELSKLKEKLSTVGAVLLDAEEKQESSHAVADWVRRLKDVVYDADDLLDDFATEDSRRKTDDRGRFAAQDLLLDNTTVELCLHLISFSSSLKSLYINEIEDLISLPEGLQHVSTLQTLTISSCSSLATLPDWIGRLTSLSELRIKYCHNLTSLPEEMRSLRHLHTLEIYGCPYLHKRCRRKLSLSIRRINDPISLPEGLQHVSTLQTLRISGCFSLATLPDWIGSLTSLSYLSIQYCPELRSLPEEMRSLRHLYALEIGG
ncbi:hypothetical protein AAG906_026524 [Vitis piasezkii]